jgi:hypothetical protein
MPRPKRMRGAADAEQVKVGRLEKDAPRAVVDLGLPASHHAGYGDGSCRVTDKQRVLAETSFHTIQRRHRLAGLGSPHDDRWDTAPCAGYQLVIVKGVQGLTPLEHHKVGYVHYITDRTHAGPAKAFAHPLRGRADLGVPNDSGYVASAQIGI